MYELYIVRRVHFQGVLYIGEISLRVVKGKDFVIFSLLFICLLMPCSASEGLVLCIGTNGHVAIETNHHSPYHHASHIQPTDTPHQAQETDRHVENPHRHPCVDISISMGTTVDRFSSHQVKENSLILPFAKSSKTPGSPFTPSAAPGSFNPVIAHSDLLHTVILLV